MNHLVHFENRSAFAEKNTVSQNVQFLFGHPVNSFY